MIIEKRGDILLSTATAIVNPINCRGAMGAGLALQVKQTYPAIFAAYKAACARGDVVVGRMWVCPLPSSSSSSSFSPSAHSAGGQGAAPRWMVNFPTKDHWRSPSRLEWIADGLDDLVRWIRAANITSIAVPKLGAGLGGLEWRVVRPLIEDKLALEGVTVELTLWRDQRVRFVDAPRSNTLGVAQFCASPAFEAMSPTHLINP